MTLPDRAAAWADRVYTAGATLSDWRRAWLAGYRAAQRDARRLPKPKHPPRGHCWPGNPYENQGAST